ncbi:MAG: hypothetical protein CMH13_05245 [Martelella sp.]|uniref:hypothetical protein n=1 Tax=unclassified Martelella TaxID=2629616 RepID=UPI000C4B8464|nr:hypothetical protein [Martelella sp.]MAU19919.1 hypothetical protein [Martelella sp.]|tara:strand:- start:1586 stop:1801 length:216 start_codon:yes stop_codon:yes gene_type:complete
MADQPGSNRSAIIAAALIFLGMLIGGYFLPDAVNYLAQYSVWLAVAVGIAFVLAVFLVFWLRGRYQKRHGR